jgi:hypothetical protein
MYVPMYVCTYVLQRNNLIAREKTPILIFLLWTATTTITRGGRVSPSWLLSVSPKARMYVDGYDF